jgi:HlyD family secretion protein
MATSKRSARRKIIIIVGILLILGGLTAYALLRKREPVITVQTEKVTRRNLTELVVANGRVQPVFYVKISPEVSGEIIALPVKEGQVVKKGDLLVGIKPDVYTAARDSSEASYKGSIASRMTAEATLRKLSLEHARNLELFQNNLISESQYQEVKTAFEIAQAQLTSATHQVEMARAALDRAEKDLQKTTIYSPLEGTIIRLNSQAGERVVGTAMMAGTEIMTIADLAEMEARVEVGEVDVPLIRVGQLARLEADAFKERKFAGTVTEIANSSRGLVLGVTQGMGGQSQEATKFEVKIRIKDKETFRPGMSVTAEVETRSRTNVLTVPIASVTTRLPKAPQGTNTVSKPSGTNTPGATTNASPGTNSSLATSTNQPGTGRKSGDAPKPIEVVFVKEGDQARMVPVKRGISDDAHMEITEGLEEGQEIVVGGFKAISRELEDGKKIKVGPAAGEKGKPEAKPQ